MVNLNLYKFNPVRLEHIKSSINKIFNNNDKILLNKIKILDIGCGGGLLCEPLSKLGAKVVGIEHLKKYKIQNTREKKWFENNYCAS